MFSVKMARSFRCPPIFRRTHFHHVLICLLFYMFYSANISWIITPLTSSIYIYYQSNACLSYVNQLRNRTGAPPCILTNSIPLVSYYIPLLLIRIYSIKYSQFNRLNCLLCVPTRVSKVAWSGEEPRLQPRRLDPSMHGKPTSAQNGED